MDTKVFCPAWAMVLAQRPDLKERIEKGEATPAEVTAAFQHSFQLDDSQAAAIKGVLALTDIKDFVRNRVSLESIMTTGPAIHVAIDFGIERLRWQLKEAGVPEGEIIRQVNAKFDEVMKDFSIVHDGERLIPVTSKNVADITRTNIDRRLAEDPGAKDSVLRSDVVMAGELAAFAAFLHPFIGGPDVGGKKTISYDELKDWFSQQKLPTEKRPGVSSAPNPLTLTVEASMRLAPGGMLRDLERNWSDAVAGVEIALGLRSSDPKPLSHDAMVGAQYGGGCPFAGKMIQTAPQQHEPIAPKVE